MLMLVAAVDCQNGAKRCHCIRRLGNFEPVAVVERRPCLFNPRNRPPVVPDGIVRAEKVSLDLPAERLDRVAAGKERKVALQFERPLCQLQFKAAGD